MVLDEFIKISIRAPLAGSDYPFSFLPRAANISIRAPLAGSDQRIAEDLPHVHISIRAPLAGSDMGRGRGPVPKSYFNPRSPCGERLGWRDYGRAGVGISIRAPLAGSDRRDRCSGQRIEISIRAPLAGSDTVIGNTLSES